MSLLVFAETLLLWARFDPTSADFQFVERHAWIPSFGISYAVGVDGISLLLLVLTGFLTPLALLSSWESVHKKTRAFCIFVLLLESAMIGRLRLARSLPLLRVLGRHAHPDVFPHRDLGLRPAHLRRRQVHSLHDGRQRADAAGDPRSGLAAQHEHDRAATASTCSRSTTCRFRANLQFWFFLAFALAFAIKVPLFPFHTWLPDAHVEAPTAGSVILAGVLLKMGTYGLVRFAFPLFPMAATYFAPYLAVLAVVGIIYGALVAMVQPDMKKLVAYSSVSHLGFVVLGIAAMNTQGVQGAVYQMLNHGVSTGGLFLIVGMLSDRRHTRLIAEFGGLKAVMPRLVAAFLIITLSSIGLPGLNGFVGEFLILLGAFVWNPRFAAFAATGVILSATYMLWMFQRVNYGPVTNEKNAALPDLEPREWALLVPIVALSILMGVLPNLFLRPMEPSIERMLDQVRDRPAIAGEDRSSDMTDVRTTISMRIDLTDVHVPERHRADGLRDRGGHCGDDGRGVPRARRADADRSARRHRPGRRRASRRCCSGITTRRASASSSPTTSACSSPGSSSSSASCRWPFPGRPSSASACRAASTTR